MSGSPQTSSQIVRRRGGSEAPERLATTTSADHNAGECEEIPGERQANGGRCGTAYPRGVDV